MQNQPFNKIPEFPNYSITRGGILRHDKTHRLVTPKYNTSGYISYGVTNEDGSMTNRCLHRLIALTYLPDVRDKDTLHVNHINGNKEENSLSNLEWCTPEENMDHAIANGLRPKPRSIQTLNFETNEVNEYPTISATSKATGITKDLIRGRIQTEGSRIFPDGLCYRNTSDNPWPVEKGFTGIQIRYADTGEIKYFAKKQDLAKYLNVVPSDITSHLRRNKVFQPGNIQFRTSTMPWPEFDPTWNDDNKFLVIEGDVVTLYDNLTLAGNALGIGKSTVSYRLQRRTMEPCRDGRVYIRLKDYEKQNRSKCPVV